MAATVETNDDSTRSRVIDAAVACILEEGFYRASSNKIARRAGVTWGVIQYHFGTREALMFAVHERSMTELGECVTTAEITGATVEERLGSLVDALWSYYRRPEFLAYMQVVLNLSHDPTTAAATRDALRSLQERIAPRIPALMHEVLGESVPDERVGDVAVFLYNVIRGLALDQQLLDEMPVELPTRRALDAQRDELVRLLAAYVRGFAG